MHRPFLRLSGKEIKHIPKALRIELPGLQPNFELLACRFLIGVEAVSGFKQLILPHAEDRSWHLPAGFLHNTSNGIVLPKGIRQLLPLGRSKPLRSGVALGLLKSLVGPTKAHAGPDTL